MSAPADVNLRRSISASYYALFHRLTQDGGALLTPNLPPEIRYRVQRWFEHAEMKRVCGRFAKQQFEQPLLSLIGSSASDDMRTVASAFVTLQESRHSADYDLGYNVTFQRAQELFLIASSAIEAWSRIATTAEANVFILSLLLWKNWERERP